MNNQLPTSNDTAPNKTKMTQLHLVFLVSLLTMIGPFTIDTYLPAFASMEQDLGVSRALMTQTLGWYIIAFGVSTLFWGAITDWIGRRPVILLSVGAYVITSLACAIAANYEQLLFFRVLQGLAIGGGLIAGRAMVRDVLDTKDAQKVMAKAMMLFTVAPVMAPIFGGWLHDLFGWRSIFWFLVIYGGLVFIYAFVITQESLACEDRSSILIKQVSSVYARTLKSPHYMRLVFIFTGAFASFFVFIAGSPTLMFDILNLKPNEFYILFLPIVTGIMSGAFVSNRLVNYYSAQQIMHVSLTAMFLLALLNLGLSFILEATMIRTILPLALFAFSLSIMMPIISVEIINCFPNNRGSASAMQSFIQMGFNGVSISLIVAMLGASLLNFTIAQVALMVISYGLWLYDVKQQNQ